MAELLCPECLGTLQVQDGRTARCTTHGGQFEILFLRSASPPLPRELSSSPVAPTPSSGLYAESRCVQHPHLPATAQCKTCGAFMCATCKFELPGGFQICPACPTTPRTTTLSPSRKKMLAGSFALAIWCTLVMVALVAGLFQAMTENKDLEEAFGVLLMLLLLVPSIAGFGLGVGVMDRRLP